MIASSYETKDSFIKCDNNNIYKEPCTSNQLSLPNYSRSCLIKKSLSFRESIVSQTEKILCEINDNAGGTSPSEDRSDSCSLNQLCTSLSCPSKLCFHDQSQSRECGLENSLDYRLFLEPRDVRSFCPVDVCTRCQDTALTLNNRGACLCESVAPCHHQALFGTSDLWSCNDKNSGQIMILQEGYRLLK